jgi:hypothetical protein
MNLIELNRALRHGKAKMEIYDPAARTRRSTRSLRRDAPHHSLAVFAFCLAHPPDPSRKRART